MNWMEEKTASFATWLYKVFPWDFADKIGLTQNTLIPPELVTAPAPKRDNKKALAVVAAGVLIGLFVLRKK